MFDSQLLQNVLGPIFSAIFLASILRVTTPILLPSLGALISDRAGVINIGLEGIMLVAAFTGVVFSAKGGIWADQWLGITISDPMLPWLGFVMGILMGVLLSLLLGLFHLRFKANLILSGIALNFFGAASTVALMYELTGDRGNTQGNLDSARMPFIQLPNVLVDSKIAPVSFFFKIFDNQSVMTWLAFISVIVVWYIMYRTPLGMHIRAVGENPAAAASVGIRVQRVRYIALTMSGILAAMGGIHMSMGYLTFFQANMTSGRGFVALATPALGGNHPIGTGLASFIFGFFDAISTRIGSLQIPSQLPQMLPYVATVMALVIYALQAQLTNRVRTLRSAEGENFDARFWKAIQRLSVPHMFMAMIAVIGLIIAVSMYSAPDGFPDDKQAFTAGTAVGLGSLLLILINLPFIINVERIGHRVLYSALVALFSLWIYLAIFFALYVYKDSPDASAPLGAFLGLVVAVLLWLWLGGRYLFLHSYRQGHGYWGDLSLFKAAASSRAEERPLTIKVYVSVLAVLTLGLMVLLVLIVTNITDALLTASPAVFIGAIYAALIAYGLWQREHWGWLIAFIAHVVMFFLGILLIAYLPDDKDVKTTAMIAAIALIAQGTLALWLWLQRKQLVPAS